VLADEVCGTPDILVSIVRHPLRRFRLRLHLRALTTIVTPITVTPITVTPITVTPTFVTPATVTPATAVPTIVTPATVGVA